MPHTLDERATVAAMLAREGLDPPPDELDYLVGSYASITASLPLLYGPDFADADPLLTPTAAMEAMLP